MEGSSWGTDGRPSKDQHYGFPSNGTLANKRGSRDCRLHRQPPDCGWLRCAGKVHGPGEAGCLVMAAWAPSAQ